MRRKTSLLLLLVVAMAAGCASGSDPVTDDPTDAPEPTESESEAAAGDGASDEGWFAGKDLEIIVPISAGGGTDGAARLIAQYLEKHIDGHPRTFVVNVAGGGSIMGTNEFALEREHDGTHLVFLPGSAVVPFVLGRAEVEYDLGEMYAFVGNPNPRMGYFAASTGIEEAADIAEAEGPLFFGSPSATSSDMTQLFAFEALGVADQIEFIIGYEGTSEVAAAFEAGEVNINAQGTKTFVERDWHLVESGQATGLFSFGMPDGNKGLERDPLLPDHPHIGEVYEQINGEAPSGEAWNAFVTLQEYFVTGGQSMWTHGDAPREAIEAIEAGLARMAEDPEFQEAAEDVFPYGMLLGDEVRAWGETLGNPDQAVVDYAKAYLTERFEVSFDE